MALFDTVEEFLSLSDKDLSQIETMPYLYKQIPLEWVAIRKEAAEARKVVAVKVAQDYLNGFVVINGETVSSTVFEMLLWSDLGLGADSDSTDRYTVIKSEAYRIKDEFLKAGLAALGRQVHFGKPQLKAAAKAAASLA